MDEGCRSFHRRYDSFLLLLSLSCDCRQWERELQSMRREKSVCCVVKKWTKLSLDPVNFFLSLSLSLQHSEARVCR